MVYFDAQVMATMNGDVAADVALTRPVIQDARLGDTLRRLFTRLDDWRIAAPDIRRAESLACEESMAEVCGLLRDNHSTAAPSREASAEVRQVRERLADELLAPPTLAELAAMTGLSTYQVLRRFEKTYGVPPHAWLVLQRSERARHLIRHGAGLAEAAAASGFSDQSHMTRIFTRQFGFTPAPGSAFSSVLNVPLTEH
jgi:AraC-like DNA-binding protein